MVDIDPLLPSVSAPIRGESGNVPNSSDNSVSDVDSVISSDDIDVRIGKGPEVVLDNMNNKSRSCLSNAPTKNFTQNHPENEVENAKFPSIDNDFLNTPNDDDIQSKNIAKGRSIAHNKIDNQIAYFVSFDIETAGEIAGIIQVSAELCCMVIHSKPNCCTCSCCYFCKRGMTNQKLVRKRKAEVLATFCKCGKKFKYSKCTDERITIMRNTSYCRMCYRKQNHELNMTSLKKNKDATNRNWDAQNVRNLFVRNVGLMGMINIRNYKSIMKRFLWYAKLVQRTALKQWKLEYIIIILLNSSFDLVRN